MSNPKISVIIALYNAETTLRRCLDSLLGQSFQDFDVIIVDDGSTDRSLEICREYANIDSRFHIFHKENGGVASARQAGTDLSKGQYIIHVDPDDWIESNMLEEMYAKATEGFDIVVADMLYEKDGITSYRKQADVKDSTDLLNKLLDESCYGSLCNKLISSKLYRGVSFPSDLFYCEDLYVLIMILLNNSLMVTNLHHAYYHYVYYPKSTTNTLSKENFDNMMLFLDRIEGVLLQKNWDYRDTVYIRRQRFMLSYVESGVFTQKELITMFNSIKKEYIHHDALLKKYLFNRRSFYIMILENSCFLTKRLFPALRAIKNSILPSNNPQRQ